jgi:hypothetical protein
LSAASALLGIDQQTRQALIDDGSQSRVLRLDGLQGRDCGLRLIGLDLRLGQLQLRECPEDAFRHCLSLGARSFVVRLDRVYGSLVVSRCLRLLCVLVALPPLPAADGRKAPARCRR